MQSTYRVRAGDLTADFLKSVSEIASGSGLVTMDANALPVS
ncbi:MAG: hypothetical protein WCL50_00745 [Spirochaetota bacterium]